MLKKIIDKRLINRGLLAATRYTATTSLSTKETNGVKNFDQLKEEIKTTKPIQALQKITSSISFDDVHPTLFSPPPAPINGFQVFDMKGEFIKFTRQNKKQQGDFLGDKLHISVNPQQMEKAFNVLAGLLFLTESPFDTWKATSLNSIAQFPHIRVVKGFQFTCYICPSQANGYDIKDILMIRSMIISIENLLKREGIEPGTIDQSDVKAPQWSYVSYRNEFRSSRDQPNPQLAQEDFFKLLNF
jgi:hypothetical protein